MKVLLIEDEEALRQVIYDFLKKEGYVVEVAGNFEEGLEKVTLYAYDCILLDIMMPGGTGIEILKNLRKQGKRQPVIITSAKDSLEDKVEGLDLGADDYLPKPFHLAELLARVKSAIRRSNHQADHRLVHKNLTLYPDERKLLIEDSELQLNKKEFDILYYLMLRPGKLVQKAMLAELIWGDNIDRVDSLDFIYSQIKNLRKKLKDSGADVDVQAIYGVGYKLV